MTAPQDDLDILLSHSDNTELIMQTIKKKYSSSNLQTKPKKKESKREVSKPQNPFPIEQITKNFVSNWIFHESPDVAYHPQEKTIEESFEFSIPEDTRQIQTIDTGLFPNDPVLKALRSKLRIIESRRDQ